MKKYFAFVLFAVLTVLFSACGEDKPINGKVTQSKLDDNGRVKEFVIQDENGKETGVIVTDDTMGISVTSEEDSFGDKTLEDVISKDVYVSVYLTDNKKIMYKNNGEKIKGYNARSIQILEYNTGESFVFDDGVKAFIYVGSGYKNYRLGDETELLREFDTVGPDKSYTGVVEYFDNLPKNAQEKIKEYYENQGKLYDIETQLKNVYKEYLKWDEKENFSSYMVSQDIVATASNDKYYYIMTSVTVPSFGANNAAEMRTGAVFDRVTGENIPASQLFSCSEEQLVEMLIEEGRIKDSKLKEKIKQSFDYSGIVFSSDTMEVYFPLGSVSDSDNLYIIGIDYHNEALKAVLKQEAIPYSSKVE